MKFTKEELLLIWLDSFVGLEYKHKTFLFENCKDCSSIKNFIESNKDYIISSIGTEKFNTILNSAYDNYVKSIIQELEKKSINAVTIVSADYPASLLHTEIAPLVLYYKGDINLLKSDCFAIVGSRKSLPLSKAICQNYAKTLSEANFTLVTGTAEGIDETVLEYATENGRKVISIVASGFDSIYPAKNKSLTDKVAKCGLLISEYPPQVKSMPYFFPLRNRIIAGLSKGVLIVSAGIKSGTLYTAEYAEEYGRDLFAIPYSVGIESGAGCNDLIKRGAVLTDSPDDILTYYGKEKSKKIALTIQEKEIVDTLKDGAKHIELICAKLNKQIFEISPTLSILEIKGVIAKTGNNVYGLVTTGLEE